MAPPVLLAGDARGWLAEMTERPPERVVETWSLYRSAERHLTLCFRRLPAGAEYVDESSRSVSLTEGIVIEGLTDELPGEAARAECHRVAQAVFGAFWEADNRFLATIPAPELDGRRVDTAALVSALRPAHAMPPPPPIPPPPTPPPPAPVRPRPVPVSPKPPPRRWGLILLLALALMVTAVIVVVAST
jgi:hypothetical protein